MTYKISFTAHFKTGTGWLLDPEALVAADSLTEAEKKFMDHAKKRYEKYNVEIISISKSTMDLVR